MARCWLAAFVLVVSVTALGAAYRPFGPIADQILLQSLDFAITGRHWIPLDNPFYLLLSFAFDVVIYALVFSGIAVLIRRIRRRGSIQVESHK